MLALLSLKRLQRYLSEHVAPAVNPSPSKCLLIRPANLDESPYSHALNANLPNMADGTNIPDPAQSGAKPPRAPKPGRPYYGKIHARPLPLDVYPLPPLIPHNPLSLLHLVYVFVSQLLSRPSSHPAQSYEGYFSAETRSVHVTDARSVRALWESGFFGKGSLSRSEPSWLEREKRKRGIVVSETSEELTRKRREERRKFKMERARKEREAIEETLRKEKEKGANGYIGSTGGVDGAAKGPNGQPALDESTMREEAPLPSPLRESVGLEPEPSPFQHGTDVSTVREVPTEDIQNEEHLQLNLEEAFFLARGLGVLTILSLETNQEIPLSQLLAIFVAHSTFPPLPLPLEIPLQPDNKFLVSYVAYHHFRSLGWVVRPGIKFGVDLLLYNRGPVFAHAEFAVMVLPAYTNKHWKALGKEKVKSWHWLHMANRVQTQVRKTLVLCYVDIPPPVDGESPHSVDLDGLLGGYKIREVVLKRWIPNRSRD